VITEAIEKCEGYC